MEQHDDDKKTGLEKEIGIIEDSFVEFKIEQHDDDENFWFVLVIGMIADLIVLLKAFSP